MSLNFLNFGHHSGHSADSPNGSQEKAIAPALAAAVTLQTYALAAIAQSVDETSTDPEAQFLRRHHHRLAGHSPHWAQSLPMYCRHPAEGDRPLVELAKSLNLTAVELLTVALAAAVESDVMIGRALAYLQAPVGGSRPTLGLLAAALQEASPDTAPLYHLANGNAVHSGLLMRLNDKAPLPEQTVRVPLHLCFALSGQDSSLPGFTIGLGHLPAVPLPDSIIEMANRHGASFSTDAGLLVLRTGSSPEGKSVAAAIAHALQQRPLFIETDQVQGLAPWLLLRHLLPVFCFNLAPGEHKVLPAIPGYTGAVLALCGLEGSVEAAAGTALSWTIPTPSRTEREALWQQAIANDSLAQELAHHHRHSSGRIAQLGQLAHHHGRLAQHPQPTRQDIAAAAWTGEGIGLETLAQPLSDVIPDQALVMPPSLRQALENLLLRCRHRDDLLTGLGAAATARYHPGVRSLFVGPSGTGKTLAAGWLATKLGLPLYRVDLAAVSSKYIGETEKNLSQLLARAEQAEVVLLFDEADSLFGKRTDVQQANDRFANAQTNYLLQRIETFDSIAILTSNSRSRFDDAFSRRLDLVIEFPLPQPKERRDLWRSHLGTDHTLTLKDLNQLAATVDLCGGHIRNAVLMASVLAQSEHRLIHYADILHGLSTEYRKLGRPLPSGLRS